MSTMPRELAAILRTDLVAFVHKCFGTISGGDDYKENWHHAAIAWQLEQVRRGEINRAIISMPPRNLKSIITSVAWPAFCLGHDPTQRFVCCSYAAELSLKHARDSRLIMQSGWYQQLFPGTVLSRSKNAEHDFETTRGGGRYSTSVGGSLTGLGGNVLIVVSGVSTDETD